MSPQAVDGVGSLASWHHDIGNDEVGGPGLERTQSRFTVGSLGDIVAGGLQRTADERTNLRFVVDDENSLQRPSPSGR